jgi:hypothetical protein
MSQFANKGLVIVLQTKQSIALALGQSEEKCPMRVDTRQILKSPLRRCPPSRFAHHPWLQETMSLHYHSGSSGQCDGDNQDSCRAGIDGYPCDIGLVFLPDTLKHRHYARNDSQQTGDYSSQDGRCRMTD